MPEKNAWVSFFEPLGKNPLAVYLLSEILLVTFYLIPIRETRLWPWLYETFYQPLGNDLGSLAWLPLDGPQLHDAVLECGLLDGQKEALLARLDTYY